VLSRWGRGCVVSIAKGKVLDKSRKMSATNYQNLKFKQYPKIHERETSEAKFWKSFHLNREEKLSGSPNTIEFNPTKDGQFLITASNTVHLYESYPDRLQRTFSRFHGEAFCGRYRKDGKLLLAGDAGGNVKVFDVTSKSLLRQFRGHTAAVRAATWSSSGLQIYSGSDDHAIRVWDLGTEDSLWYRRNAHTDYIRTMSSNPVAPEVFVSGSYDHTLKLWDTRQKKSTATFHHGAPVESCLISPSGTLLFSAGSNELKIWDILTGSLINTFSNHQKNITGICMDSNSNRLLSCGLDGHVKIYSLDTLEVKYGLKYSEPILSMALSKKTNKLILGFVSGNIMIRNKEESGSSQSQMKLKQGTDGFDQTGGAGGGSNVSRFYKGTGSHQMKRSAYDDVVETERFHRLHQYDIYLKQFRYSDVLDLALKSRNPVIVITILEELCRRNGLTISLNGRDESTLEPLISFCSKYISLPKYTRLLIQVIHRVLDIYGQVLKTSDAMDELFHKLNQQVKLELSFHRQIMRVMGSLDGIINTGSIRNKQNQENQKETEGAGGDGVEEKSS
jgi:U3 small nucleolar RNA-associated protein 15